MKQEPETRVACETGWLVEENSGGFTHWIALAKDEWPLTKSLTRLREIEIDKYLTPVIRVKDSSQAIRFARREDAEAFIRLFDSFLLFATATEHQWLPADTGGKDE